MSFKTSLIRQFYHKWGYRGVMQYCSAPPLAYSNVTRIEESTKFFQGENNFAHQILAKTQKYCLAKSPVFDEAKAVQSPKDALDWKSMPIQQLCDTVELMSHEAHKLKNTSDPRFMSMFMAVKERSGELNDDQLAGLISNIILWPYLDSLIKEGFYDYWKALDDRCIERRKDWDMKKLFYFIDLWYLAGLARPSTFVFLTIKKITKRPNRLNAQELVQVFFYLNILRTVLVGVGIYDLEHRLLEVFDTLTVEEIGIALMGFFKTQHVLHNSKLLVSIFEKLRKAASTMPEVTLTMIVKTLRFSMTIEVFDQIQPTLDVLEKEISRLSVMSAVHITLLVTKGAMFHKGCMTKVAQKLVDNIAVVRLKDIEKAIYPLVLVSFDPQTYPCIFKTIKNELQNPRRESEFETYPKTLVALLHYLSLRDFFIEPLIARVLDEKFILKTYGKNKYNIGREILCLDTLVQLQCPNYEGPRLDENIRNYLSKRYCLPLPQVNKKPSKHTQNFIDVLETLEAIVGKDYACKYLLPNHPRPDIVFRYEKGKSFPLPDSFLSRENFTGIIPPPEEGKWFALVTGSRNMFSYMSNIPTGETHLKLRQLKLLGYIPILVSHKDWPWSSTIHKLDYLKKLIAI